MTIMESACRGSFLHWTSIKTLSKLQSYHATQRTRTNHRYNLVSTAIKQLEDATTQHEVPVETTKEKAIDTLFDLLTPPAQHESPVNKSILPETMDHPLNNTTAPSTPNKMLPVT